MKFQLFLLFAFVFSASASTSLLSPGLPQDYIIGNCSDTYYCTKPNAKCTADWTLHNTTQCQKSDLSSSNAKSDPNCCPILQFCGRNGTCVENNDGDECKTVSDCYGSILGTGAVNCVSGYCRAIYGAGDGCNDNSDCYQGLTCNNDTNTCTGLEFGKACAYVPVGVKISLCQFPNYCNATQLEGGFCVSPLATGAQCPEAENYCYPGTQCDSTTKGTCTTVGTIKTGDACGDANYVCDSGNICFYGECTKATASKLVTCTNNSDCTSVQANSSCLCGNDGKGYCTFTGIGSLAVGIEETINLVECLVKYNCSVGPENNPLMYVNNDKMSCGVQNCNSYVKKYFSAVSCNNAKKGGSCYANPYCGGFPVWAIVVIVVVAIILVLSVVIVVFLVLRKRRDYSSI